MPHPGKPPRCIRHNIDARRIMTTASWPNAANHRVSRLRHLRIQANSRPLPDTAECCIGCNKACSSNHVTVRAPRRRHPHCADRPSTSPSPLPSSASSSAGRSSGTPKPPRSATSTRTAPVRAVTVTVTVSPGRADLLCRRLLPKSSSASKTASAAQGCPGPRTAPTNAPDNPRPLQKPSNLHALANRSPSHQRTAFPPAREDSQGRTDARKSTLTSTPTVKPNTHR